MLCYMMCVCVVVVESEVCSGVVMVACGRCVVSGIVIKLRLAQDGILQRQLNLPSKIVKFRSSLVAVVVRQNHK